MKKVAIGLVILALACGGALVWRMQPVRQTFFTDADQIHEPLATAAPRDVLWQPPVRLPDVINTATGNDYEPKLSADGLTLFFVRGKAGGQADIYMARRMHQGWTKPEPVAAINSKYDDLGPEISADGQTLYFYSDRPGGLGGYDLWMSRRGAEGWQPPTNLGPEVNSEFNDYGPALTPDGKTLYFASNRPTPQDTRQPDPAAWSATLREDIFHHKYDIYAAAVTDAGVGKPEALAAINTPEYNDGAPAVSPFGDFLYFCSDRPGGQGGFDVYRSRRLRGALLPPENLGPSINTPANELDPALGMGGYALFFSSDRKSNGVPASAPANEAAPGPNANAYAVYYTTSREVFRDTERFDNPINWAALWAQIGPNLLKAILALLLLALLLALLRDARGRRLSLLTKCLLASLAVHLVLMILFNFWQVGTTLALTMRQGGGPIRVGLSPAVGGRDSITAQIRGTQVDVKAPEPMEAALTRSPSPLPLPPAPRMAQLDAAPTRVKLDEAPRLTAAVSDAPQPMAPARLPSESPADAAESESPPALTLALPAGPPAVQQAESKSNVPTPPAGLSLVKRPAPVAASQPSLRDVQVALAPDAPGGQAVRFDPSSVVVAAPTSDASVAPPTGLRAASPEIARDPPRALQLAMPSEANPRRASARPSEAVAHVAAAQVEGPRSGVAGTIGAAPLAGAKLVDLTPSPARIDPAAAAADTGAGGGAIVHVDAKDSAGRVALPPIHGLPGGTGISNDGEASGGADHDLPPAPQMGFALPPGGTPSAAGHPTAEATGPAVAVAVPNGSRPSVGAGAGLGPTGAATGGGIVFLPPQPGVIGSGSGGGAGLPGDGASLIGMPAGGWGGGGSARGPGTGPASVGTGLAAPDPVRLDLRLPTEEAAPENRYAQRAPEQRLPLVQRMGGSKETEEAVALALKWLSAHQSSDGRWSASDFDDNCEECGGTSNIEADSALTGMSLLCFLAADHTHKKDGPYRDHVRRGLKWLRDHQKDDGDLRGDETMYSHAIATLALSEAYGMTKDTRLADPVRKAVEFICAARARRGGGWRYEPGQAADTSVTGWQVMALRSAQMAGIDVPTEIIESARQWLDRVAHPTQPGRYAYQPGRSYTPAMTAEAMFVRELLGAASTDEKVAASARYLASNLPDWKRPNTYYWYYGTLALFQYQGEAWSKWNEAVTKQLLTHQRKAGRPAGSWDPVGEWAPTGGRVYQTAICTLILEVYYRYLPMYLARGGKAVAEGPQTKPAARSIRGRVTDAATGRPLVGTTVRLDLPGHPLTVTTAVDGTYVLNALALPEHVAMSASHDGYVPASANLPTARLGITGLIRDFALSPSTQRVIAVEAAPDVHHLGNDRFEGPINSQFQKPSEGESFEASFELTAAQLSGATSAELHLLTKGVQCPHKIRVNDRVLQKRLCNSPEDGSFGECVIPFDADLLHDGANTIQITTSACAGDIDDYEFVNVQIHLASADANTQKVSITPP